jgi:putative transposase
MSLPPVSYKRHRFLAQIIAHAVWLYFRIPLSLRLVEEMPPAQIALPSPSTYIV